MSEEIEIGNAARSASALVDRALGFDADIADSRIKYSVWVAAGAAAGFQILLSNFDKLRNRSSLSSCHIQILLLGTGLVFLLSIASSATILALGNRYLASFKQERTLIAQREFIITNHPKEFAADVEARLVMNLVPTELYPDQVLLDLASAEGGALVELDYDSEPAPKGGKGGDRQRENTDRVFRLLTKQFKELNSRLKAIKDRRVIDERRLRWLERFQRCFIAVGYVGLLVLFYATVTGSRGLAWFACYNRL
jgi:hypothetical protein